MVKLGITSDLKIDIESDYYQRFHKLYEEMGDHISLQYGGSVAHHAPGKKKGFIATTTELVVSFKRHFANNFTDPQKQNVLNLFLGIYQPLK